MGLGKNLKMLLEDYNIKVTVFAKEIGYNPSTIYSIIRRDPERIKRHLITEITGYFGISTDEFLEFHKSKMKNADDAESLSYKDYFNKRMEQEKELVVLFRNLSEINRTAILNLMKNLNGE